MLSVDNNVVNVIEIFIEIILKPEIFQIKCTIIINCLTLHIGDKAVTIVFTTLHYS